jgi:hypothetical protein
MKGPVQINQDCEFKAIVVRPNGTSSIFSEDIFFNKATMKPITLKEQPSKAIRFQRGTGIGRRLTVEEAITRPAIGWVSKEKTLTPRSILRNQPKSKRYLSIRMW